jgi:hypothetical protein
MILLNFEKQCIYMYRGRMMRREAEAAAVAAEENEEVSLGAIPYFPYHFTIQLAFLPYFSISFHYSTSLP